MMAGILNWPQGTFASKVRKESNNIQVTREIDGGLETVEFSTPAIVTTDLRLNEPRYASLPNIMKAKSKPIELLQLDDLGIDTNSRLDLIKVSSPPKRGGSVEMLSNPEELIEKLKNKEGIL